MSAPSLWSIRFSQTFRALAAIGILCGIWRTATFVQSQTGIPVPASVLGIGILFLLLAARMLPLDQVKPGSDWLVAEMLLFFVPAVMGIVRFFPVLATYGGRLLIAIGLGTVFVMISTALAVDATNRMQVGYRARRLRARSAPDRPSVGLNARDLK